MFAPRPLISLPRRNPAGRLVLISLFVGSAISAHSTTATAASSERFCAATAAPTHPVERGDNWFAVAVDHKVTIAALLLANEADSNTVIFPGDVLCLPGGSSSTGEGSAGERTARGADASSCPTSSYLAQPGDSWFGVARRHAVSPTALLEANAADVTRPLLVGDELCLPAGVTAVDAGTAADDVALAALPLQGPCGYADTWGDARGNGRGHAGIDILAASGRYVYAVTDGVLTRRAWDQPGRISGNAWWLTAADGTGTYYYYGHLFDFAPGLEVGSRVQAGEIIGFIGSTGNSAAPHVHFEIHPNGGGAINPYGAVDAAGGCNTGTPYRQPGGWVPESGGTRTD